VENKKDALDALKKQVEVVAAYAHAGIAEKRRGSLLLFPTGRSETV
jgi:hypothetical protein